MLRTFLHRAFRVLSPTLLALLALLTTHAVHAQTLPSPAPQPSSSDDPAGFKRLRQMEQQEHDELVRNTPPLRFGVWEESRTPTLASASAPSRQPICSLHETAFLFGFELSSRSGGVGKAGIRFHSVKQTENHFIATTQVVTPRLGLATAEHHIVMQSPQSFTDQVTMSEGKRIPTHYILQGRWIRECGP